MSCTAASARKESLPAAGDFRGRFLHVCGVATELRTSEEVVESVTWLLDMIGLEVECDIVGGVDAHTANWMSGDGVGK